MWLQDALGGLLASVEKELLDASITQNIVQHTVP